MSLLDEMMATGAAGLLMHTHGTPASLTITTGNSEPVTVEASLGRVKTSSAFHNSELLILSQEARILRSELNRTMLTTISPNAKATVGGEDWSIRPSESEWGNVWVKLVLDREMSVREWQARRNAPV